MNVQAKLTLAACAFALLFSLTVPLVSEATYRTVAVTTDPDKTSPPSVTTIPITGTAEPPPATEEPPITTEASATAEATSLPADDEPLSLSVYLHKEERTVTMSLEEYIVSVVAAEMPYTFHTEALKAQAVAARTYCLYKMENGATHEDDADVCSNYAHCAAYISEEELIEKYGEAVTSRILTKVRDAVESTEGEILTYNGKTALTVFHSRSYITTESAKNVWGSDVPYLTSVSTPEEDSISTVSVTKEQLEKLFDTTAVAAVNTLDPRRLFAEKNDTGRQDLLYYGGKVLKAKTLRSQLGFRSCRFEIEETADGWIFTVHGYGHGVGMSQYGANEMAKNGTTYEEILTHYYSGTEVVELEG